MQKKWIRDLLFLNGTRLVLTMKRRIADVHVHLLISPHFDPVHFTLRQSIASPLKFLIIFIIYIFIYRKKILIFGF